MVLFAFLIAEDIAIVLNQRSLLMESERNHMRSELELMQTAILESMLRNDYSIVSVFIAQLGKRHKKVIDLHVVAPNGFVIAEYHRPVTAEHSEDYTISMDIDYGKKNLATVKMKADYREVQSIVTGLNIQMFAASSIFILILGVMLWYTQKKTAIEPLEEEIEIRAEVEEELRRSSMALEAVNKELESFAYSVSHDLRSPLRAVDGFSQALMEDCSAGLTEDCRMFITRIRAGCQRMERLIADMLKLSRITRMEMKRQDVDLSNMARDIVAELKEQDPGREVDVKIQDAMIARADPALIRMLLDNLLGNAWKFTSKTPGAKIEFFVEQGPQGREYCVADNGAGFNMSYSDKLFGAFQRLHTDKEFAGTGIGLATVQRIIARHGGTVRAKGETNKGASFYFTLSTKGGQA